ncbi:MAG: phosphoribosylformylglycinamidine synthase subunit PurQ [Pseudomonadota bacterium]
MKSIVIVFPGSNCDRDVAVALARITGIAPRFVWHQERALPKTDLIALPGGFSYGDYLRSGAMAARSPVMAAVVKAARAGTPVLGICNGFQILTECGLLPGVLMRNAGLKFVCRDVPLSVTQTDSIFTRAYGQGQEIRIPIAHHDGNYFADEKTLDRLEGDGRVAFRYRVNPNGSARDIAGIFNQTRTILGLMPHPERLIDRDQGGTDGRGVFESLMGAMAAA